MKELNIYKARGSCVESVLLVYRYDFRTPYVVTPVRQARILIACSPRPILHHYRTAEWGGLDHGVGECIRAFRTKEQESRHVSPGWLAPLDRSLGRESRKELPSGG